MFSILALYTTFRSLDLFRGKSYFGVHILFKNCPMFIKWSIKMKSHKWQHHEINDVIELCAHKH